ncbi:MAG: hypothetical protein AB1722_07565 [Pseudomonadota bacterium]
MFTLDQLPTHIYVFAAILGVLALSFILFFFLPSLVAAWRLSRVVRRLRALGGRPSADMAQIFAGSGVLEHLWQEYADSLHHQSESRWRSTVPASLMFPQESLIDTPLRTDFFKHLPGLFTGVGIIGTFYGLIMGLQAFQVSENASIVRESLNHLLHGVWEAFLVSAAAISLAMAITLLEKLMVTRLISLVEQLTQLLDGMFEGGASEEYLARLVKATEASSGQTATLLRNELQQMMSDLFEKQMAATSAQTEAIGKQLASSLENTLKQPLTEIAGALKATQVNQQDAVQKMLAGVLTQFTDQMKDLFGSQVGGINSLQQQTIESLQTATHTLQQMAAEMQSASKSGNEALANMLAETMAGAEARQRIMNEKLGEFVEQVRALLEQSQGDTKQGLQQALDNLSDRMGVIIEELGTQVRSAGAASKQQQDAMAASSQAMVGQFNSQVTALVEGVNLAIVEMKAAVQAMRSTTGDALTKLNNGADTLYLAAKDFAKAGDGVTATLDKSAQLGGQLAQAAGAVGAATNTLSNVFADYQKARDAMTELVGTMQLIVEQAKRDAAMSHDVVSRIEGATAKLVEAQQQADGYLDKVSDVIGHAHESFSNGLTKAVGEANREFHQALSDSVKLLREGIQELEDTLGSVSN